MGSRRTDASRPPLASIRAGDEFEVALVRPAARVHGRLVEAVELAEALGEDGLLNARRCEGYDVPAEDLQVGEREQLCVADGAGRVQRETEPPHDLRALVLCRQTTAQSS